MPNHDQKSPESPDGSDKPKIAVLAPVVDVRSGEVAPMFASMLWIFLALTAYYIIKPIRSTVLQTDIGVDNKAYALLATTAFVGVFAYVYGKIVPRVARNRLIIATFVIFIACLSLFALVMPIGGKALGYVFYIWVSTFNLMVVSQFWSLAADVWTKEEGKRLFGFIGVGAVGGGIFGTVVVSGFAKSLSIYQMLFLAAGILGACLGLALYILHFAQKRTTADDLEKESKGDAPPPAKSQQAENAIALVFGSPYLLLIALMMLLVNLVNTSNEWVFDKVLSRENLSKEELNAFYARYYLFQNVITFCIQFFLTSRIQRRFGARVALLFLPLVGMAGGLTFLILPTLFVIRSLKIAENATDYSIQANTRELLYLPVSKIEKYSAKNFNDTFVVRAGDALAAGLIQVAVVMLIPMFGDAGLKILIGVNLVLGVIWILIVTKIGRMHRDMMAAKGEPTEATKPA